MVNHWVFIDDINIALAGKKANGSTAPQLKNKKVVGAFTTFCELWDRCTVRIIEWNSPHATYCHSKRSLGAGGWKLSFSPRLHFAADSLTLSVGWLSSCVEEPPDWQLHMCRCNYGPANWQRGTPGHCHYWHNPYTCRWNGWWPLFTGRNGGTCACVHLFEIGVKRDGRKAEKEGQRLGDSCIPFLGFFFFKIHGPCFA